MNNYPPFFLFLITMAQVGVTGYRAGHYIELHDYSTAGIMIALGLIGLVFFHHLWAALRGKS